jgi:hypothetical protein
MQALVGQGNAPAGEALAAALKYAARGWPVLPLHWPAAGGCSCGESDCDKPAKHPLTLHGVKDATTDPDRIRAWFRRWPKANLGIATGDPGPTVLDVDDLAAARSTIAGIAATTPTAATPGINHPPGRHHYLLGTERGTVGLGWGELRGCGSYVVAPPSIGANGRLYVWTCEPNGTLPPVPAFIAAERGTRGTGDHEAPMTRVPHGQRHDYLLDFAVRLVRGGITDRRTIEWHLWSEFERACEPHPAPKTIEGIAHWAAGCDIAQRERRAAA